MNVIKSQNLQAAIGLSWIAIEAKNPKADVAASLNERRTTNGLLIKGGSDGVHLLGLATDNKAIGSTSLAHASALVYDDFIAVIKLPSPDTGDVLEQYWIVGARNGVLNTLTDIVVSTRQSVLEEINNRVRTICDDDPDLHVYCDHSLESVMSDIIKEGISYDADIESDEPITCLDYYEFIEPIQSNKKVLAQAKVKSLKSNTLMICLASIALLVLAGSAYFFIQSMTAETEQLVWDAPSTINEPINLSNQEINRLTQEQILELAYIEELQWLTSMFNEQDPSRIVDAILAFNAKIPDSIAGWKVIAVSYDRNTPEFINIELKRESVGTPVTLKQSLNTSANLTLKSGGTQALVQFPISDTKPTNQIDNAISHIKTINYKSNQIMHDSIMLGMVLELEPVDFGPRKKSIEGIVDIELAKERQVKNVASYFKIEGSSLLILTQTRLILKRAKTSIVNRVEFSRTGDQNWNIEGIVYEK
ncbi:hypothetical protein AB6D11_02780 [Vibrio splendidus]